MAGEGRTHAWIDADEEQAHAGPDAILEMEAQVLGLGAAGGYTSADDHVIRFYSSACVNSSLTDTTFRF